jgi:hypothetical protein
MAGDEGSGSVEVASPARAASAAAKGSGNVRPRRCARRRIPLAALGLKENLEGDRGSKTADKEDPTASLGDSEESAVQHSPRQAVPEVSQGPEDHGEVCPGVGRRRGEEPGSSGRPSDVLQEKPLRAQLSDHSGELEEEAGPSASETCALRVGRRDVLAGEPPADESDAPGSGDSNIAGTCLRATFGVGVKPTKALLPPAWVAKAKGSDVAVAGDSGEPAGEDAPPEGIGLDLLDDPPSCSFESMVHPSYPAEQANHGWLVHGSSLLDTPQAPHSTHATNPVGASSDSVTMTLRDQRPQDGQGGSV